MIPPLLYYTTTLVSQTSAYQMFCKINDLDLSDSLFDRSNENLVAFIIQTNPLVINFRNQRDFSGRSVRYSSTTITATIKESRESTDITLQVRTNWSYLFLYGIFLIGFFKELIFGNLDAKFLSFILLLIPVAIIDMLSKASLLARVKSLFNTTGYPE